MKGNPFKKLISGITAFVLLCVPLCGCAKTDTQTTSYSIRPTRAFAGKTVDACKTEVRSFINNRSNDEYTKRTLFNLEQEPVLADKQAIELEWRDDDQDLNTEYTVYIADDPSFTNALTFTTQYRFVADIAYFVPGCTYYYKVEGNNKGSSAVDSFTVRNDPVRYLSAGAMHNVRDLGGWTAEGGKKIKYNMLFRGGATDAEISNMDDTAKLVFNHVGIKYELDLRGESELVANTWNGSAQSFTKLPCQNYKNVLYPEHMQTMKAVFDVLSDRDNYPIYFHCGGGADRTATVAYLVNGLCGVSWEDLRCDYELTSFSVWGVRSRSKVIRNENGTYEFKDPTLDGNGACLMQEFHDLLIRTYGNDGQRSLAQTIAAYLEDCGVSEQQLNTIKSIMLGD